MAPFSSLEALPAEEYFPHHWAMLDLSGCDGGGCWQGPIFPRFGGAVVCGSGRKLCGRRGVDAGDDGVLWALFPFLKAFSKILLSVSPDGGHVWRWWSVRIHVGFLLLLFLVLCGFRPSFSCKPGHSVLCFSSLNEIGRAPDGAPALHVKK